LAVILLLSGCSAGRDGPGRASDATWDMVLISVFPRDGAGLAIGDDGVTCSYPPDFPVKDETEVRLRYGSGDAVMSAAAERAGTGEKQQPGEECTIVYRFDEVPVTDVVVCHHVLYNVPDLVPFVAALTRHARTRVVVELTARHPLTTLAPLWLRFHGLARPTGPTAEDALAVLGPLVPDVAVQRWTRPRTAEYGSLADLVDVTRRRLCLPAERSAEVADALAELGVRDGTPVDLGSSGEDLVTLVWAGSA